MDPLSLLNKIYQRLFHKVDRNYKSDKTQIGLPTKDCSFCGPYFSWEEAEKQSTGYNSDIILEKVKKAALKVKRGEAVYERDSVLFDKIQYSWPLLSGLLWIASMNNNRLNLIDFGGSLGTSYYQNKKFLKHLKALRWNVIEQDSFVKCGKEFFEDEHLKFHFCIEDCMKVSNKPDAILISGVLEYIEKPYELLGKIFGFNIKHILIDRTPFSADGRDYITIQKVHPEIYKGSFPHRFFSHDEFKKFFHEKYELVEEFDSFDKADFPSFYKGFIFSCRKIR
jgi:putative methyltransferase (TIGR04325 family)